MAFKAHPQKKSIQFQFDYFIFFFSQGKKDGRFRVPEELLPFSVLRGRDFRGLWILHACKHIASKECTYNIQALLEIM